MNKGAFIKFSSIIVVILISFKGHSQSVYKTPSGKKYHLGSCRMVENVSEKINENDISKFGLEPCKICKPPVKQNLSNNLSDNSKAVGISKTAQCKGITKKSTRCLHKTSLANGYCYQHTKQNNTSNNNSITPLQLASTTCGAKTKSGGHCKRKVKNGGKCYQH